MLLPPEMVLCVFRCLSVLDVAFVYRLVCRDFCTVAGLTLATQRRIAEGEMPAGLPCAQARRIQGQLLGLLSRHCRRLQHVDLRFTLPCAAYPHGCASARCAGRDAANQAALLAVLAGSRFSLEQLLLPAGVRPDAAFRPLRPFSRLRVLGLAAELDTDQLAALHVLRGLEALELGRRPDVSYVCAKYAEHALVALLDRNPRLKILALVDWQSPDFLRVCALPDLVALALPYMRTKELPASAAALFAARRLVSLNLGDSSLRYTTVRDIARTCPGLTRFSFTLTFSDATAILEDLCKPGCLPKLEYLGCRSHYSPPAELLYEARLRTARPTVRVVDYATWAEPQWCALPFDTATLAAELLPP